MKKCTILLILLLNYTCSTAQQVSVANERENFFYVGLDNPLSIAVEGLFNKSLVIKAINGTLLEENGRYSFRPDSVGLSEITIYKKSNGQLKEIGKKQFRSKNLPLPFFKIGSGRPTVTSEEIAGQQFVRSEIEGLEINIKINLIEFNVHVISDSGQSTFKNTGNQLSNETREKFKSLKTGDILLFTDIYVGMPDKKKYLVQNVSVNIKNKE
ncbi:MAG: hypothetical protein H7Y86_18255 [Rhizobacter sp.]|nr:hypothetical protein [Ferruginibacter sp.]